MENILQLGKAKYTFNPNDSFTTTEGMTYRYVSLKKNTQYKHKEKLQIVTCRPEDWPTLRAFLIKCFTEGEREPGMEAPGDDTEVPF